MKVEYVTSLQANKTSPPLNFGSPNSIMNPNFPLKKQFTWAKMMEQDCVEGNKAGCNYYK